MVRFGVNFQEVLVSVSVSVSKIFFIVLVSIAE